VSIQGTVQNLNSFLRKFRIVQHLSYPANAQPGNQIPIAPSQGCYLTFRMIRISKPIFPIGKFFSFQDVVWNCIFQEFKAAWMFSELIQAGNREQTTANPMGNAEIDAIFLDPIWSQSGKFNQIT